MRIPMKRSPSTVFASTLALTLLTTLGPTHGAAIDTSAVVDSKQETASAFIGFAAGHQYLNGNSYLTSLFSRYTNDPIDDGGFRGYFVLGAATRYGVFEAHFNFFDNEFTTGRVETDGRAIHFEDFSIDGWYRWQFRPLSFVEHLSVAPGLGAGVNFTSVWLRVSDSVDEELLDGVGMVIALGAAVDYRLSVVSIGIEYQYRHSAFTNVEVSEFVTFPGEGDLNTSGSVFYISAKLYWEIEARNEP
jgi:hypothetical protein